MSQVQATRTLYIKEARGGCNPYLIIADPSLITAQRSKPYATRRHPISSYANLSDPISAPVAMEAAAAAAATFVSPELRDALTKVAVFVLVQALVYLILRKSSDLFSKDKLRTMSFRPMRSMSVRRVLAPLSDVPVGTDDPSPSPWPAFSTSRRWSNREE